MIATFSPAPEEANYELIHPFDLHDILIADEATDIVIKNSEMVKVTCYAGTENEYSNEDPILEFAGKRYLQTTAVPYKSTSFA